MDIIANENETDRHTDQIEADTYHRRESWRSVDVVHRRRRMSATLRWRWAILIIAALSTLCWIVLVLLLVWLLAAL